VGDRHLAPCGLTRLARGPHEQRRARDGVDVGLAVADVGRFLGLGPEGEDAGLVVERGGPAPGAEKRDLAGAGVAEEHRAEERAVVEQEPAEDRVGGDARDEPLGPPERPLSVARLDVGMRGEPAEAAPEAAGPVAGG
jgi:hypothetical protein